MNKGKMRCKRDKAAAAARKSTHSVVDFFFCPSTLLKCLLNICPFDVEAITEHLSSANSTNKILQKSRNEKGIMAWHILAF